MADKLADWLDKMPDLTERITLLADRIASDRAEMDRLILLRNLSSGMPANCIRAPIKAKIIDYLREHGPTRLADVAKNTGIAYGSLRQTISMNPSTFRLVSRGVYDLNTNGDTNAAE